MGGISLGNPASVVESPIQGKHTRNGNQADLSSTCSPSDILTLSKALGLTRTKCFSLEYANFPSQRFGDILYLCRRIPRDSTLQVAARNFKQPANIPGLFDVHGSCNVILLKK